MDDVRYLLEVTNELKLRERRVLLAERSLDDLEKRLQTLNGKNSERISDVAMLMMQERSRKTLQRQRNLASAQLHDALAELARAQKRLNDLQNEAI